jgi:hypothetical protein
MKSTTSYGYISPRTTTLLRQTKWLYPWALGVLLLHWVVDLILLLVGAE